MRSHVKRRGIAEPGSIPAVLDMFANEVRFYREIAPVVGIRVPACQEAVSGPDGTLLVMEDLSHWAEGADPADYARLLATLHARWLGKADWPWLRPVGAGADLVAAYYDAAWPGLAARDLPPRVRDLGERLLGRVAAAERSVAGPLTLVHGDASARNVRTGPGGELCLLDWEDVSRAPGVLDLAWLLVSSVEPERWAEVVDAYGPATGLLATLPAAATQGFLTLGDFPADWPDGPGWIGRLDAAARWISASSMTMTFDYLLVGATGQVGRCVLRRLVGSGTVAVLMRRPTEEAAYAELAALAGELPGVRVVLGDVLTAELPPARDVVHSGGHTLLVGTQEEYLTGNVLSTVRLARHARDTGGHLHLLSSAMVAMAATGPFGEAEAALPDPGQTRYALSKCLAELAAERILGPDVTVYRTADTVPDPAHLAVDVRLSHWLTLLLGTGGAGLLGGARGKVWALPGDQLGAALVGLIGERSGGRWHLLGETVPLTALAAAAPPVAGLPRLARRLAGLAGGGFPVPPVTDGVTRERLGRLGLEWTEPGAGYWERFGVVAAEAVRAAGGGAARAAGLWFGQASTSDR